jgi:hypothetical protein
MLELLSSEEYSKKLPPATANAAPSSASAPPSSEHPQPHPVSSHRRTVILNGLDTPHSSGHWDESPEDLALTSSRFSIILERLALENIFLTASLRLPQHLSLCQRLLTLALRYQEQSLALANGKGSPGAGEEDGEGEEHEEEILLHRSALLDLLADSALSYALALVSHLRPLVPGTLSSKVRLLQSRARGRFLSGDSSSPAMATAQYEDFAVNSLLLPLASLSPLAPTPQKIFRIFVHCLLAFAALASAESLRNILGKIFGSGTATRLLSVLRHFSSHPLDLPAHEIHRLRAASHLILRWISARYPPSPLSVPPDPPSSRSEDAMGLLRQGWAELSSEQRQDTKAALVTWSHGNTEAKALIKAMLPTTDF